MKRLEAGTLESSIQPQTEAEMNTYRQSLLDKITIDEGLAVEDQPLLERRKSNLETESKPKSRIPETWDGLSGDVSEDPIAQSLLRRFETNTLLASLNPKTEQQMSEHRQRLMEQIQIDVSLCITEPVVREKLRKVSSAPSKEIDIPDSWYGLQGDISKDPIAQSLMKRIQSGTLNEAVSSQTSNLLKGKNDKKVPQLSRQISVNTDLMVLDLTPFKSDQPKRSTTTRNFATEMNVPAQPVKQLTMKKTKSYQAKAKIDIPPQWQGVRGDISEDPIAQSLMIRLEAGSLDKSTAVPPGHVLIRPQPAKHQVSKDYQEFVQESNNSKIRRTNTLTKQASTVDKPSQKFTSQIPRLTRAQTMATSKPVKVPSSETCGKKIPKQWDLEGDLTDDPIAISLLTRIKSDCISEAVAKPSADHVVQKCKPHNVQKYKSSQLQELAQFESKLQKLKTTSSNVSVGSAKPKTPGLVGKKPSAKAIGLVSQTNAPVRKSTIGVSSKAFK